MTNILELNNTDARTYFLKEKSYISFDLPPYFTFEELLGAVSNHLGEQNLESIYSTYTNSEAIVKKHFPEEFDEVNYKILNNKDGKYAWRPLQVIHPVLYVSLVHKITQQTNWNVIVNRFTQFQINPQIRCYSIPIRSDNQQSDRAASISQWLQTIEQQSIELALKFEYVLHTDITDCYGSIYTHSISWAIHTKPIAKEQRFNLHLIGNVIDKNLRCMANGQTNGIPQGSVLMDFISEIVLGYADLELSEKIIQNRIHDYEIIRYRDDYRIFANNPQTIEEITKLLTEVLIELGMRLNSQKTIVSNSIILNSLKPDKLFWLSSKLDSKDLQEQLLIINKFAQDYPNSGSLIKSLDKYYNRIKVITETEYNISVLVSILVDVMFKNPRTYPIASAVLSKLLSLINETNKKEYLIKLIWERFKKIPNTGHIKIWMQRITIKFDRQIHYTEKLCEKVNNPTLQLWNSNWIENNLKAIVETSPIIDEIIIESIDPVIASEEIELFKNEY